MKNVFHAAAALAAMISTVAQAAEPVCMTRAEVNSVVAYALPVALEPVMTTCKQHLAPDAYLLVGGRQIAANLAAKKADHWQSAKAAVTRVWGGGKLLDMPDDALQATLATKVAQEINGKIKPRACKDISAISARLSPLSPDEMVALASEIIIVAVRGRGKAGADICQDD